MLVLAGAAADDDPAVAPELVALDGLLVPEGVLDPDEPVDPEELVELLGPEELEGVALDEHAARQASPMVKATVMAVRRFVTF